MLEELTSRRMFIKTTAMQLAIAHYLPTILKANEQVDAKILSWDGSLAPDTLEKFNNENNNVNFYSNSMPLNYDYYHLKEFDFDLVFVPGYALKSTIDAGLLARLDQKLITNLKNIDYSDENLIDRSADYAIPYSCGTIGMAYNSKIIRQAPKSWEFIYNHDKFYAKTALLGSAVEMVRIALKMLGYSLNETSDSAYNHVESVLISHKKIIKDFFNNKTASLTYDLLSNGVIDIVQEYSGLAHYYNKINPDLEFVIPKEGSGVFVDYLAIPANAKNKNQAHSLIDFLLRTDIALDVHKRINLGSYNKNVMKFISKGFLKNSVVHYGNNSTQLETFKDLGHDNIIKCQAILNRLLAS